MQGNTKTGMWVSGISATAVLLIASAVAPAEVILSRPVLDGTPGGMGLWEAWHYTLDFRDTSVFKDWPLYTRPIGVFDVVLSNGDEGITITRNCGPAFERAARLLANDRDDWVFFALGEYGGGYGAGEQRESEYEFSDPQRTRGIDLTGYRIDSMSLRVDRFELTSPGSDPNGDGNWTDYTAKLTLVIEGSPVPEPGGGAALALLGTLLLAWRGRRRDADTLRGCRPRSLHRRQPTPRALACEVCRGSPFQGIGA